MKPTLPTLLLAATLCASVLVTPQARADYMDMSNAAGMMAGIHFDNMQLSAQQMNLQVMRDNAALQTTISTGRKSPRGVGKTKPKKALTTTTYRESPTVHKQILGKFTRHLRTQITSKEDAESLCREFEGKDVMALWSKEVAENGLVRSDVADALTYYWVASWMIANRVTTDPKRVQVQAVRRFFTSVLSSTPAFAKATGAQRQEMAEAYIYTAVLQGGLFAQVFHTGNKALIQKVSDGQNAQFKKETGIDLRLMKLTNAGFAAKS